MPEASERTLAISATDTVFPVPPLPQVATSRHEPGGHEENLHRRHGADKQDNGGFPTFDSAGTANSRGETGGNGEVCANLRMVAEEPGSLCEWLEDRLREKPIGRDAALRELA